MIRIIMYQFFCVEKYPYVTKWRHITFAVATQKKVTIWYENGPSQSMGVSAKILIVFGPLPFSSGT